MFEYSFVELVSRLQDGYRVPKESTPVLRAARANVSDCFAVLHQSIVGFYTVGTQTGFAGTYLR